MLYPLKAAVYWAKFPKAKPMETVEVALKLGVDPKQSDQIKVRGTVCCPTARDGQGQFSPGMAQRRTCRQSGGRGVCRLAMRRTGSSNARKAGWF